MLPNWLKFIINLSLIVTFLILFKKYTGSEIQDYLFIPWFWKWLIIIYIIYCLYGLFYCLISLYICSTEKKISLPKYTPKFLIEKFDSVYETSKSQDKNVFAKIYFTCTITDIILLILAMIGLFIVISI